MIDDIFIKDENEYINYSKLKPSYKYSRKKLNLFVQNVIVYRKRHLFVYRFRSYVQNVSRTAKKLKKKENRQT